MYIDLNNAYVQKWLLQMILDQGQPQSPGAGCQQAAISRLPDISKAAPFVPEKMKWFLQTCQPEDCKTVAQPPSHITV